MESKQGSSKLCERTHPTGTTSSRSLTAKLQQVTLQLLCSTQYTCLQSQQNSLQSTLVYALSSSKSPTSIWNCLHWTSSSPYLPTANSDQNRDRDIHSSWDPGTFSLLRGRENSKVPPACLFFSPRRHTVRAFMFLMEHG